MKVAALAIALMFAAASLPASAHGTTVRVGDAEDRCNVRSDWGVSSHRRAFVFSRADHAPAEVGIGGGRLFIDGREQTLSAADHARLARLEAEMHALVPELREVVTEAVDIAFSALTEVARGLASDPQRVVSELERARRAARGQLESRPLSALNGDAIAGVITPILTEFVPQVIGGAVTGALKAAFGGEVRTQEFEKKMKRMERELDSKVEARAKDLEPLAKAMCRRLETMDRIDDELEYRLPDGKRLDLLQVGPRDEH